MIPLRSSGGGGRVFVSTPPLHMHLALRRCSAQLAQLLLYYLLEAFSEATDEGIWIGWGSFDLGPFAPAWTWTHQSTEKLQQDGVEERLCHVGPLARWDVVLHRALSRHKDLSTARGAPPDSVRRRCLCTGPHGRPTRPREPVPDDVEFFAAEISDVQYALRRHLPGSRRRRWLRGAAVVAVRGERWDCICMLATCVV